MGVCSASVDKLYHWILRKYEEESRLTIADIMAHIQHEMDYRCSDALVAQGVQQQYPPSARQHLGNSSSQLSATSHGSASGLAPRAINTEQSKNSIFSNALSSPVRRSLQSYHPTQAQVQGGGNGGHNSRGSASPGAHNRETNSAGSNDTAMDMVSDSAANEYY
ncbi:hypothetical protein SETIT_3G123100v2 [Setaria italica]|uniref:Uncharacterized protein n=1 Tax=Setaria italica TaxID=4555 RepID=A0A368QEE5_SETIT|nr:hypothetical protein SETIT_3G123100v2 [Setaria italica]